MSRFQKIFVAFLALGVFSVMALAFVPKVQAFEIREGKNLAKDEVVNGDLFIGGESVKVAGTVNGNLFVGGTTVEISGKVTGNVFAGGSVVYVTGEIGRTLFVGASTLDLSGTVGRDMFAGAGQLTVNGKVTENIFAGAGSLYLKSDVGENLYAGAGQVTVLGNVGKDAFISAGTASIEKEQVKGSLNVKLEEQLKPNVTNEQRYRNMAKGAVAGLAGFALFMKFVFFVGTFLVSLLVLKYFAGFSSGIEKEITESFGKNLGIGLLVSFASPFIFLFLLVTLVGIPLALGMVVVMGLLSSLSTVWMGDILGRYAFGGKKMTGGMRALSLFVGQLLLALVSVIPVLGFLTSMVVNATVLGAFLSTRRASKV